MNKRLLMAVLGLVMTCGTLLAQSFTVQGTVISKEDGEPLIGVAVRQLENPNNGVITDFDGNYSIKIVGKEATLSFTYVGMQEQQHKVNAKTEKLDVEMLSDAQLMEEVVVVAYGVRKKGTVAGSVSMVKADKIAEVPAAGFDQALQGQTAGLTVLSSSGEPSKAATFQIRGTNSINSGTAPLFILDGVPISSSDFNTISPNDIESVSVLKDASSTSIYGARAANGVVVITTKRGPILSVNIAITMEIMNSILIDDLKTTLSRSESLLPNSTVIKRLIDVDRELVSILNILTKPPTTLYMP